MSISEEEYPNELLGLDNVQDAVVGGINQLAKPVQLATESAAGGAGATGAVFHSGAGAPKLAGHTGDFYFRTDGNTGVYRLSAGQTGATSANWTGLV